MLLHDIDIPQVFHANSLVKKVLDYTEDDKFDVILMNPPYGGSEKKSIQDNFPDDIASSETADLFMGLIMYRLKTNGRAAVVLPDGFLFGTDNAKVNLKKKLFKDFNLHTIIRLPKTVFSPYTGINTNLLFFENKGTTKETWFYRLDMPSDQKHFSKTKPMKLKHFDPVIEWWNHRIPDDESVEFPKSRVFTIEQIKERGYNIDLCGYPHENEDILDPTDLIQNYEQERASLNTEIDNVLSEITNVLGDNKE